MVFEIRTKISANWREVRYGQRSHTEWTGTRLGCINSVRLILQMLACTKKSFPLAITDGINSQQLPRRGKLFLSMEIAGVPPEFTAGFSLTETLKNSDSPAQRAFAGSEEKRCRGGGFSFLVHFVGNVL